MEANVATLLMSSDLFEVDIYNDYKEVKVDPEETIEEVFQQCLTNRTTSQIENKGVSSHAKLQNLARRKMLN